MRYERKYRIEGISRQAARLMIRQHPACFREVHAPRKINSLYFDSWGMDDYAEKVVGAEVRQKYRIRWYGAWRDEIRDSVLEVKRKLAWVGEKDRFPLVDFAWEQVNRPRPWLRQLAAGLPAAAARGLSQRQPLVLITYRRAYFLSRDGAFRLTLDDQLQYYRPQAPLPRPFQDRSALILEMKYEAEDDPRAQRYTSAFPFRLTRNSKYADAIEAVWGGG
jgi:SPX domain protein involved in polyphosphate accumulation